MKKLGMILACAALLVSLFTAGAFASGDMAGSSGEPETASLTEDLTLEAGVYEENIEANGYRVTLLGGGGGLRALPEFRVRHPGAVAIRGGR